MKRAKKFRDDPGVAEVRRWRAKMFKQAGGTIEGLMDMLRANHASRTAPGKAASAHRSAPATRRKGRAA